MPKRQFAILLLCNFIAFYFGSSVVTLMPIYTDELGADPAQSGWMMAIAFVFLAISTLVTGRLTDRLQRRKGLLLVGAILTIPSTWLMGQAATLEQLTVFMMISWFVGGVVITCINILAGLFAAADQRGRVFGILGLGGGLGGLVGGLTSGPIVDRWDFEALFTILALLYVIVSVAALFLEDKPPVPVNRQTTTSAQPSVLTNRPFLLLCIASVLAFVANSEILLARSLIMDRLEFDATALSLASAVGSLVTLPLPLLVGWLSDRLGRKPFIISIYLLNALGLLILAAAFDLWHFWAVSALQVTITSSLVVGSAMVTDMFPKETLGVSLSLFAATSWIGNVIGFGATGSAMQALGTTPSLLLGALLIGVAVLLLAPPRPLRPIYQEEA